MPTSKQLEPTEDPHPNSAPTPSLEAQTNARKTQAKHLLKDAQAAIEANQGPRALGYLEDARILIGDTPTLIVLRGIAQLLAGHDLGALHDFQSVLKRKTSARLIRQAQLGAAEALERQGEFDAAEAMLDTAGGDSTVQRARLNRSRKGEPAINVCHASDIVMHDTLERTPATPKQCYGYFAVQANQVARAWNGSADIDNFLNASYQFVELLGQLRNTIGDPIFGLRYSCDPASTPIPEQRQLTIALIVRVTGDSEAQCREYALGLWEMLVLLLPGTDKSYYFSPVVDETTLVRLLAPFPVETVSQIVRREDAPMESDGRYTVYPFTARHPNLHGLCKALQQQKVPSMVSIHLLPTALMSWEAATLDRNFSMRSAEGAMPSGEDDPVNSWRHTAPLMAQAQVNLYLREALRNNAYILMVHTACTGRNPLFAAQVAMALFGPQETSNGSVHGGYEVIHASSTGEVDAAVRNLNTLDVEHWVPSHERRLRHLVSQREAALAFRLPVPGPEGVPGVALIPSRPTPPPPHLPATGTLLGQSVARVGGMPVRVRQGRNDRRRHTYVVGKTGTGKSTLLENAALQDIEDGQGICVIDPHGELVNEILLRIPENRAQDVVVFDPSDDQRPVGLNLLEARSEAEKHMIVNEFIGLLILMYDPHNQGIVGPRFQHNVRNAMLAVMAHEGGTLIEVVRALSDYSYVKGLMSKVTDPLVRTYWLKQIPNTSDYHKSEILDWLVSKFSRFVGDERVRHIIGQRQTTLDFRRIMDERKILLVNLSKGKIGPENAQFLGLLLIQRLLLTALSRADMPMAERADFMIYVDEFQNFATPLFATMLSEGRKYGVAATMANQYLTQLIQPIREAVFGNVGTLISFNLGTSDAQALTPEMQPVFGVEDLVGLPKFTACAKLLVDGGTTAPFTMQTLPNVRPPDEARRERLLEQSRERYGRDANELRAEIEERFSYLRPEQVKEDMDWLAAKLKRANDSKAT